MINQIVKLKNGNKYRILDKIIIENNTFYLSFDLDSNIITTISPKNINEIIDMNFDGEYYSKVDIIKKNGIF